MRLLTILLAVASLSTSPLTAQSRAFPAVTVVSGTLSDGHATGLWHAILKRRLSPTAFDSIAALVHPILPAEQAWADMIATRAPRWASALPTLAALFPGLEPQPVRIVLGNRGAEDAFTHDSLTIGFDLAALVRVYGAAPGAENADRLDRLFQHEVTHTLQKRWLVLHPYMPRTPLERALLEIWLEGLGNYFSLSPRWRPDATGARAPLTEQTLTTLEPRFADRMARLACADSVAATPLLATLSSGPFQQKWGALPAALWLLEEQAADSLALRTFVNAGPTGVWPWAQHHLPDTLAMRLSQSRDHATACTTSAPASPNNRMKLAGRGQRGVWGAGTTF